MEDEHPKPPVAGVIYGKICYWIVLVGILIAIVGMIMYFTSDGYFNKEILLDGLWDGELVEEIWTSATSVEDVPHGHWYLSTSLLSNGDVVAMMGIAICCVAAVIGMWGALIGTIRSKERLYSVLALIVALILTLSAAGIVTIE